MIKSVNAAVFLQYTHHEQIDLTIEKKRVSEENTHTRKRSNIYLAMNTDKLTIILMSDSKNIDAKY